MDGFNRLPKLAINFFLKKALYAVASVVNYYLGYGLFCDILYGSDNLLLRMGILAGGGLKDHNFKFQVL